MKQTCLHGLCVASLLTTSFLGTGCSTSDEGDQADAAGRATPEIRGDRRVPFSPANDREFAEYFADHHTMAIHMATQVMANGESSEVRELAQRVIDAQTAELRTLEAALESLADTSAPPPMPQDPHMTAEIEHMMVLAGEELDQMFLIDMIAHHAAGLAPAHRAHRHLDRDDLRTLASSMFEAQSKEIGEIRTMLVSMNAMDAGEDMAPSEASRPDFGIVGDRRIPLTPADDVQFVDFFIPHHRMAIAMAEEVIARGHADDVKVMAESMRDMQMMETESMQEVRASLAGSAEPPAMPDDSHMKAEMDEMMHASGEELDRMFLEEMIPHHAAGLPTTHRALPHVQDPVLRDLADDMYDTQAREIAEMQQILEQFSPPL